MRETMKGPKKQNLGQVLDGETLPKQSSYDNLVLTLEHCKMCYTMLTIKKIYFVLCKQADLFPFESGIPCYHLHGSRDSKTLSGVGLCEMPLLSFGVVLPSEISSALEQGLPMGRKEIFVVQKLPIGDRSEISTLLEFCNEVQLLMAMQRTGMPLNRKHLHQGQPKMSHYST